MKTTLALVVTGMLASATAFAGTAPAASTTPAGTTTAAAKSTDDCARHAKKLHGKKREEAMKKCAAASSG